MGFTISILSVCVIVLFVSTFWSVTLYRTLNSNPLAVTLKNYKSWLCSLEKKKETLNVDHFCVFFNFFRERKSIKVVFLCFRYFFPLSGSCESGGEKTFSLFFFIIHCLRGGGGGGREKGVYRNFHF